MKFVLIFFLVGFGLGQSNEILKKSDRSRSIGEDSKIEILVETYHGDELDKSERMDVYERGGNKSLVRLLGRKDQLVLMVNESMWLYFPNTRKPMRITPFQRLMGDANNGDIARLSYFEDYTATLIREEQVDNISCFLLELTAKSKSSTYRKIHYWVSKNNYLPIKADYFMISGKHFKTAYFENYKKVNGQTLIGSIRFYKVNTPNKITVMKFLSFSESDVPNKYFNKNYLRKIRF